MTPDTLEKLLLQVKDGDCSVDDALKKLHCFPGERIDSGCIDHQRQLRTGIPEVIFGQGKSAEQIIDILDAMKRAGSPILVTRVDPEKWNSIATAHPDLVYHPRPRMISSQLPDPRPERFSGPTLILSAGTSDLPVASEALVTLQLFGCPVQMLTDTGVAGLHRLLAHQALLKEAKVIIVAAGMEGALPSVVAGLVQAPVIGVPTSVGYGASFGGIAALLGMLNSCAPGVSVVNIDNGFGAACMAHAISRLS